MDALILVVVVQDGEEEGADLAFSVHLEVGRFESCKPLLVDAERLNLVDLLPSQIDHDTRFAEGLAIKSVKGRSIDGRKITTTRALF